METDSAVALIHFSKPLSKTLMLLAVLAQLTVSFSALAGHPAVYQQPAGDFQEQPQDSHQGGCHQTTPVVEKVSVAEQVSAESMEKMPCCDPQQPCTSCAGGLCSFANVVLCSLVYGAADFVAPSNVPPYHFSVVPPPYDHLYRPPVNA